MTEEEFEELKNIIVHNLIHKGTVIYEWIVTPECQVLIKGLAEYETRENT